jgi:hypothetical protein
MLDVEFLSCNGAEEVIKYNFSSVEVYMAVCLRTLLFWDYDTMSLGNWFLTFQRNIVPSPSRPRDLKRIIILIHLDP